MLICDLGSIKLCELSPICVYEHHKVISSTNDRVRELFNNSFVSGVAGINRDCFPCLVVADEQTAGRGRNNKRWWSGIGGLMMSLGVELGSDYFPIRREVLPEFSPIVGKIVADVIKKYIMPSDVIEIHYPNDVYVNNKKISGILIESPVPDFAIIGIGINVNNSAKDVQNNFDREITTILDLTGNRINLCKILVEFVAVFFEQINLFPNLKIHQRNKKPTTKNRL
jgi:biotin-[acetyl-CoA-carboxylase] ligase BirA-like protein